MLALKHAWREPACPETDFILVCPEPGWVALFACAWPGPSHCAGNQTMQRNVASRCPG